MSELIEYRVRPVTRYIVTRYYAPAEPTNAIRGPITQGEYDTVGVAFEVAYALCKAEHDRNGWSPDDARIQYPRDPRIHGFDAPQVVSTAA